MITIEQVEKLRERADISYEDAKEALEITGGDLLEAVIYLEKQGKIPSPQTRYYNTQTGAAEEGAPHRRRARDAWQVEQDAFADRYFLKRSPRARRRMRILWKKLCALIKKTNANQFEVYKDGQRLVSMPVTLLLLSLLCFFWVTIPLLIIGLFFACRYRFCGPDFGKDAINHFMEQAADTADDIRRSMMEEAEPTARATQDAQGGEELSDEETSPESE